MNNITSYARILIRFIVFKMREKLLSILNACCNYVETSTSEQTEILQTKLSCFVENIKIKLHVHSCTQFLIQVN